MDAGLEALRLLGWTEVSVTLDNAEAVLRAEADENTQRKTLTRRASTAPLAAGPSAAGLDVKAWGGGRADGPLEMHCAVAGYWSNADRGSVTRQLPARQGGAMTMTTVLDRDIYTEAEAARLLNIAQGTLHYWLEGGRRGTRFYQPIIRIERRGERIVTWNEFVEAGLLRQYRHTHRVPMAQLRQLVDRLRDHYDVPYPLAHSRPFVSGGDGQRLILQAQEDVGLEADFCLVAVANDQLLLTPPSESFIKHVDWDGDLAAGWRPDPESPVTMRPDVRFGRPSVGGISTDVLWEQAEAGESEAEIATVFDLRPEQVYFGVTYERSRRLHAVPA